MLIINKQELLSFGADARRWQGIPSIAVTAGGRLFVAFYSGGDSEQLGNYCVLQRSDDDGLSWSTPVAVAYNGENHRCYDPCLWYDPSGRLWFFWSIMPDHAVWAARCDDPDADELAWSAPKFIGRDVMMNKPIVTAEGCWLLPIAVWKRGVPYIPGIKEREADERLAYIYRSKDAGESFKRLGGADMPERVYDEHMLLELADGRLEMYVRTRRGIGKCTSRDGGDTWGDYTEVLTGPSSRFYIGRLASGRLLLVYHHKTTERKNLTAMLSEDEGQSWKGILTIDGRPSVSYPDVAQAKDGSIYIVYDRERGARYNDRIDPEKCAREILLARITERDILRGQVCEPASRLKMIVSKIG